MLVWVIPTGTHNDRLAWRIFHAFCTSVIHIAQECCRWVYAGISWHMAASHDGGSWFVAQDWLLDDPLKSLAAVQDHLKHPALSHPYASVFKKRMSVTMIYASNRLEKTLPEVVSEHETYELLTDIFEDAAALEAKCEATWDAEGGNVGEKANPKKQRCQLIQHMRALKFLMSHCGELTVGIVKKTHQLLMDGAVDDDGVRVANGSFRTSPCHAGTHVYPEGDPATLELTLQRIIDAYNRDTDDTHPAVDRIIVAPVRLFYDVITLHPFQNGNGRLCRLLLAWGMMNAGIPFPVPLTTGHTKARTQYMKAILRARRGDFRELNTMALMSVEYVLANFMENARLSSA